VLLCAPTELDQANRPHPRNTEEPNHRYISHRYLAHEILPNVQDEPRPWLARLVLLGARDVTAMVVGSGALFGSFLARTNENPFHIATMSVAKTRMNDQTRSAGLLYRGASAVIKIPARDSQATKPTINNHLDRPATVRVSQRIDPQRANNPPEETTKKMITLVTNQLALRSGYTVRNIST
jgi:hypothetical protein